MKTLALHAEQVDKKELEKLGEFVATLPKDSALKGFLELSFETLNADLPVVLYAFGTKK